MRLLTLALPVLLMAAGGKDEPEIQGLHAHREGNSLLVSFELIRALDEPTLERIQSGLPTQFRYVLRLEHPRRWWFDRGLGRTTLEIVAMYNAVTLEYLVNYKQDGKLFDSRVVTGTDELEQAMTMIHRLAAFELEGEPRGRQFLRVRAELGSRHVWLLFPRTISTDWARLRLDRGVLP